jgi:hypothetical protein
MSPRDQLDDEFTWQVEGTLSQSLTLQYDKVLFILEPSGQPSRRSARVTVVDYPDGRLAVRYKGAYLPTAPSTRFGRSSRPPWSRTNGWARCWR